jgi:hypothetical protein
MKYLGGRRRSAVAVAFGLALSLVAGATVFSCSSSSSKADLAGGCSINSDCNAALICAFGRCHIACTESRDCTAGERCVASSAGTGVCQLSTESTCSPTALCQVGEVCGNDGQCRASCASSTPCPTGDYCLSTPAASSACYSPQDPNDQPGLVAAGIEASDGAILTDGSTGVIPPVDGSAGGGNDGSGGGGNDGGGGGDVVVNTCPSAQTQFGLTAQGDANPSFTSGVGVRTASQLLIFSGYSGPDPTAGDGGDGGIVNRVYIQAFDPTTALSLGPAQPLFAPTGGNAANVWVATASAAPTGEIVVVYGFYDTGGATNAVCNYGPYNYGVSTYTIGDCQNGLYAAFLAPSTEAGAGLQVQQTVPLASSLVYGQAHAAWNPGSQAFVISWEYYTAPSWFLGLKNFRPNGAAAGGDTAVVPTNTANGTPAQNAVEQGSVAPLGSLLGVAFQATTNSGIPWLSVLDATGNQVGSSVQVASNDSTWVAMGATTQGFVYVYDNVTTVGEALVQATDAGPAVLPDAGDAGYAGFTFPGAIHAIEGRALSDNTGGTGGVGVALLYANGASFAYVNADGLSHVPPSSVIAHTYAADDLINLSNFAGSFGLSLYSSAAHSTQMAASGCAP